MTNFEMHKDLILNLVYTKPKKCLNPFGYAVASFCGSYDWEVMMKWLFSEYEPPLLENDDGLQPGDWIMVRNHESDSWNKRQFLCFYEHLFIASDDNYSPSAGGMFSSWKFARLPMEGECK